MEPLEQQLTLRDARYPVAAIMSILLSASLFATRSGHYVLGVGAAFLAANFAFAVALGQAVRAHVLYDDL